MLRFRCMCPPVIGCNPLGMLGSKLHRSAHVCNMRLGFGTVVFFNKINRSCARADVVKLVDTQDLKS
jgi:hypothetical protein